jgi:hypothetical protein
MNTKDGTSGMLHCILSPAIAAALCVGILTGSADCLRANVIPISPITVDALSTTGVSFGYVGTLMQNDSIELTVTGDPCLQSGPAYCVNGAGVVTVAGTSPVGAASTFSGLFGGTSGTWDYGALLMEISGTSTVQIFPADAADGLGSGSPPSSLTLPLTTLSALGFPAFSEVNLPLPSSWRTIYIRTTQANLMCHRTCHRCRSQRQSVSLEFCFVRWPG